MIQLTQPSHTLSTIQKVQGLSSRCGLGSIGIPEDDQRPDAAMGSNQTCESVPAQRGHSVSSIDRPREGGAGGLASIRVRR